MGDKLVRKTFIGTVRAVDTKNHVVEAVVSDETIDRYQEVIRSDAWKKHLSSYKKHPVLLSSHDYRDLQSQIGMANSIRVKDKALVAKFRYFVGEGNEQADWGFKLAQKKLAAFSVGFIAKKSEEPEEKDFHCGINSCTHAGDDLEICEKGPKRIPKRIFTEVELLEVSQVLIPANPSALQKMVGAEGVDPDVSELAERALQEDDLLTEEDEKNYVDELKGLLLDVKEVCETMGKELGDVRDMVDDLKEEVATLVAEFESKDDGEEKKEEDYVDKIFSALGENRERLETTD